MDEKIKNDGQLNNNPKLAIQFKDCENVTLVLPNDKEPSTDADFPFNNLPPKNPLFTGRDEVLETIKQKFQEQGAVSLIQVQAISGLGGIGKSAIAKEFAFRRAKDYSCIWWVNAETESGILEAYTLFARLKKLLLPEDKEDIIIIYKVREWMRENKRWLFIFDNADEKINLDNYRPASNTGHQHILVTSRCPNWAGFKAITIEKFLPDDAFNFVANYTEMPVDDSLKELAKEMDYFPLALEQAAAYIKANKVSYEAYLKMYCENVIKFLKKQFKKGSNKDTVAITWQTSFDKITNPASKQLLNIYAFLAPDNIRKEWFPKASEFLPIPLQETVMDEDDYNEAIAELTKYSLVNLNDKGISLHRLVQEVVRDSIKEEETTWRTCGIHILNGQRYFDFGTAESRFKFSGLVPHILSVTEKINERDETKEVANLYFFLGRGFDKLGDYPQALAWYQKALAICEKVSGTDHPDTANTYNNIGSVYDNLGDYPQALAWYQKDLAISEKVLGTNHPATASTYNNIALVYYNLGDYPQALAWCQKDLAISEKVLGTDHPATAVTYNNIGEVYDKLGDYLQALEWFQKALVIKEKVSGTDHPDTAVTYNNIGGVYDKLGDYPQALAWYQKALAIREKVLGKDHPDTAIAYNNIGSVYYNQDDYPQALEWFQKSLAISEKILGKDQPNTRIIYNNMKVTYTATKNPKPFEDWLREHFVS